MHPIIMQYTHAPDSDHSLMLIVLSNLELRRRKPFRFMVMWMRHEGLKEFIQKVWRGERSKSPLDNFSIKLKILKSESKKWNRNVFGNVYERADSFMKIIKA